MTRLAMAVDRIATLLAGAALIALGAGAVAWQRGDLVDGRSLSFAVAVDATRTAWWPWALAAAGVVLILLGLRWLAAHRPARKASRVILRTPADSLPPVTGDAASVAQAAAVAIRRDAAVLKASGTATVERGTPTVTVTATVRARQGLRAGARAADATAADIAVMLGESVATRTILRVDDSRRRERTRSVA